MKRLLFFILVISMGYFTSCQKDDTTKPNSTKSIIDTWKVVEQSQTFGTQNYNTDISKDTSSSSKIIIDNFFNFGLGHFIHATQSGQTLTISNAVLDGYIFNGTGNISSNYNTITWNFSFEDGNGPENATATYTRM